MAAGVVPPEPEAPAHVPQTEEERAFWLSLLPKPRQEVDCDCAKDGTPQPFCASCLGTGKHARRTTQTKAPKSAAKAPEKT